MILFAEVMFCKQDNISGENRQHIEFIKDKAIPLFESWGYKVKVLHAEKDYLDVFHKIIERPRKHESHRGKKYGFAISGLCSVKRDCKIQPIQQFYRSLREPVTQYVGICIDEPERLESMHKSRNQISLLEKYGYTELMARRLCEEYDLLSPSYKLSKRGGCWFCPNAKLREHKDLKRADPATWNRFIALEREENLAHDKWNSLTKETLEQRNQRISPEAQFYQFDIFDFIQE